jgi:hypothetical protein
VAGFHVDFGDCVFDCGGVGGCYDKNTTGLGERTVKFGVCLKDGYERL